MMSSHAAKSPRQVDSPGQGAGGIVGVTQSLYLCSISDFMPTPHSPTPDVTKHPLFSFCSP